MSTVMEENRSEQTNQEQSLADVRRRAIEDRVLLLSPTVGRWEGRLRIPKEQVAISIAGHEINTDNQGVTTPYTVMVTDSWPVDRNGVPYKKRFSEILRIKDRVIRKYSIPFSLSINGARIVPKHKGVEFFAELIGLTLGKLRRDLKRAQNEGNLERQTHLENQIAEALRASPHAMDSTAVFDPTLGPDEQSFSYRWDQLADEFCADLEDRSDLAIPAVPPEGSEGTVEEVPANRGNATYPPRLNEEGNVVEGPDGKPVCDPIPTHHGVLTQIRTGLDLTAPGVWPLVQNRVPASRDQMRSKFYSSVFPVELATGSQFTGVTADLLSDYRDVVDQAMEAAVNGCIEEVIERPREELRVAMENLKELINRDGRVTARSFEPIYAAIDKLKLFSFACDEEMLQTLDTLSRRMGNTIPTSLNRVTAANNGFTAALDSVMAEIDDADRAARDFEEFGKDFRGISL